MAETRVPKYPYYLVNAVMHACVVGFGLGSALACKLTSRTVVYIVLDPLAALHLDKQLCMLGE